jgi:phosphoribosyl-AMP cyclohydrolase
MPYPSSNSGILPDGLAFNSAGLIPAVAVDVNTREVLMLAWMNEESILATIKTGYAHYWSRSRNSLWKKGETSGHLQKVIQIKLDCDGDTLLLIVEQIGAACHTGKRNCFFKTLQNNEWVEER